MTTPLVSVLIPCYNAEPWVAATLESALAQTWPNIEIIVVDDGSKDDSLRVAQRFESRGVRIVSQPNAGASAARNHALRLARGELIQFLDADDLLTPDKIAAQVTLLRQAGRDCIASCRWGRFLDDPAAAAFVNEEVFRDFEPLEYMLRHVGAHQMMHPAAWLTPREVVDRAGPWDETLSLNDDGEFFARVVLASRQIVFCASGASLYRSQLPGSLSRRRDARAIRSVFRSVELVAGHVQRAENSPRVHRALADYWQYLLYDIYPDEPELCRRAEIAARALGGATVQPEIGRRERWIGRLLGWKLARRLKRATQ